MGCINSGFTLTGMNRQERYCRGYSKGHILYGEFRMKNVPHLVMRMPLSGECIWRVAYSERRIRIYYRYYFQARTHLPRHRIFSGSLRESGVYDGMGSIVFFYGTKRRLGSMIAGFRPAIIFCNRKNIFCFLNKDAVLLVY